MTVSQSLKWSRKTSYPKVLRPRLNSENSELLYVLEGFSNELTREHNQGKKERVDLASNRVRAVSESHTPWRLGNEGDGELLAVNPKDRLSQPSPLYDILRQDGGVGSQEARQGLGL